MPITKTIPLPRRCPKCKSIRWNQRYSDEELALIDRLQDELYETGLIRESGEKLSMRETRLWEPNHAPYLLQDKLMSLFVIFAKRNERMVVIRNGLSCRHQF